MLHFFEHSRGSLPAERSLSISLETARDYLLIESATAAALCLVSGNGSSNGDSSAPSSLFSALAPGARTDAGRSLLRASLLQPLAHAPTIVARHEAVAELASEAATTTTGVAAATGGGSGGSGGGNNNGNGNNGRFGIFVSTAGPRGDAVSRALRSLPRDLDKALGILSLRPCRSVGGNNINSNLDSARATAAAASRVDSLARGLRTLRLTLSALPALAASLEGCSSSLLVAVRANVGHSTFNNLENLLRRVLEDDPLDSAAAFLSEFGAGDDDDDDDDDDEGGGGEGGKQGGSELGDEFDDGDDGDHDAWTQATASRSARPFRRHRGNSQASNERVSLPRPPEPTRSAYAVRAERGGLLEAAREALSAAAAGAAAEAGEVRALGGAGGARRRRGGGGKSGSSGSGGLSPAWRACLSKAKLSHTTRKGFVAVLPKAPRASYSSSSSATSATSAAATLALRRRRASDTNHFHLPAGLSLVSVRPRGGAIEVSTATLAALNARAAAALADCLLLSEQALESCAAACLEHADFLHRLADNVALVDALSAFAGWARGLRRKRGGGEGSVAVPRLVGAREPLALGGLRCALLDSSSSGAEVIPNDVYLALMGGNGGGSGGGKGKVKGKGGGAANDREKEKKEKEKESESRLSLGCLHVVTGPNSGGKSTYLRAIGLAVVISQAGGLVPARVACLPVLTRLSLVAAGAAGAAGGGSGVSSALASSSGFAEEAAGLSRAIEAAGEASQGRCLTLLDEPGRGTSAADGAPLAWAAAEALSCSFAGSSGGQRCVIATHHPLLSAMEGCYAFARSWHLLAECRRGNARNHGRPSAGGDNALLLPPLLRFAWKVARGPCPVRHYGLALAPSVGIPRQVVAAAAAVASAIEGSGGDGERAGDEDEEEEDEAGRRNENGKKGSLTSAQRSLLEAAHRLRCIAAALRAGADEGAIVAALSGLRREAAGALREAEEAGMVVEA